MPGYLLGIDNGGTVAKAGLFALDGRELAVAARKTEMLAPRPGHTERDTDALWQATAQAIRAAIEQSGVRARDILGVATAGHGNGLYLVDAQGRPVRNGIISTDGRAKDYVARWHADGTFRAIHPRTMQSLWPAQPGPLLAWLRDHEPETIRRARWALMVKDYIRFRLTGEFQGELTDMSATSLVDVAAGQYDDRGLAAMGLAELRRLLPPIRRSEEVCGQVTAEAAEVTGLAQGTPVAGGLFDVDACGLACGLVDERPLVVIAGTWSINQFVSPRPVVAEDLFMTSRYCVPGQYLIMEASATSASNLEWFVTQFLPRERELAEQQGRSVYDLCNEMVAGTRPDEPAIIFLPFLYGSIADANAKACLLGMSGWHTRAHVLRAIYEGIVFGHLAHYQRLLRFRRPPQTVRLTGGAARSDVWVQMFADCYGLPMEIPAGTELGAMGAAVCAAVAAGCYPDFPQAVTAMVRLARVQEPDRGRTSLYAEKYGRYQEAAAALGPLWGKLV